jgi:hypothetical protein
LYVRTDRTVEKTKIASSTNQRRVFEILAADWSIGSRYDFKNGKNVKKKRKAYVIKLGLMSFVNEG